MQTETQNQNIFHIFIQYTDLQPKEASYFPYFQYMNQSIRKAYNQVKKSNHDKATDYFSYYWQGISKQQKVRVYCSWIELLQKAVDTLKDGNLFQNLKNVQKEDNVFIRKPLLGKWEKKMAKLNNSYLVLEGQKNIKTVSLKNYALRKSKNKQYYGWVLETIQKNDKSMHFGVPDKKQFQDWFSSLENNINNERVIYFMKVIKLKGQKGCNQGFISPRNINHIKCLNIKQVLKESCKRIEDIADKYQQKQKQQQRYKEKQSYKKINIENQIQKYVYIEEKKEKKEKVKKGNQTLTETIMKNHMEYNQELDQIDLNRCQQVQEIYQQNREIVEHPNIFGRLFPEHSLVNFTNFPSSGTLLFSEKQFRIFQLYNMNSEDPFCLKVYLTLPFNKSDVFKILTGNSAIWNSQVQLSTVKTKISSQNTAIIYEKDKSQGFLYRNRDYFFLRHCFSVEGSQKLQKTYIVDKSIDSIHNPPFMTVARGQKELICCIAGSKHEKQCMLIVQGWIKGGGYMNTVQSKEMTLRKMKKLMNLQGCLKQYAYTQKQQNNVFLENWIVDINYQEQEQNPKVSDEDRQQNPKIQEQKSHQLEEFMKMAEKQQKIEQEQGQIKVTLKQIPKNSNMLQGKLTFNKDESIKIPQKYLITPHSLIPQEKGQIEYFPHFRGHHLWKGEWSLAQPGGLNYVDEQKMKQQKKVLIFIIKKIGKNITSGKGILNVSLPVDIFCRQSNIQRLAMSFGYGPVFLQKAAALSKPQDQLKYVIASGMASSLIYLTMEKPFNPILGQTYQCWVDGCPIYFEQISHHPPIAAFYMKGRGYVVHGQVEAKMDLSINSGKGNNEGIFNIQFDNGNKFHYTTAAGELSGLTYGQRKLNLVGKSFYWSMEGLFLEINFNPSAKNRWFFNSKPNGQEEQKMIDYFQGYLRKYPKNDIAEVVLSKKQNKMIIPKNAPNTEAIETYYKVWGRWTKYTFCGQEKVLDVDEDRYIPIKDEPNPLPSHSNYRQDIVYRRVNDVVKSQEWKQTLEIEQRKDKKLRQNLRKR